MKAALVILCSFSLFACTIRDRGEFYGECNLDGTCNHPSLKCNDYRNECRVDEKKREDPSRCQYESECFCDRCGVNCAGFGKSLLRCDYSDTSVWGSKPAVCECGSDLADATE